MNKAGTLAVFDADYFTYQNVIPNLECAKLITYYRLHNKIAVLTPKLNIDNYSNVIIRKEYDDGIFPNEYFLEKVSYGGRAFNPDRYEPLPPHIEDTVPNMHIYDPYINYFGNKQYEREQIKRILNCAHIRLSPDSCTLPTFESLKKYFYKGITGIFLHDYDLSSLKAYDLILELQNQRKYVTRYGINPYPVGNKYPIKVYNSEELEKWLRIITMNNTFSLEYYGLMENKTLYKLCCENGKMARQIYYNILYGCTEDDFIINRLPKIFLQALFLRRQSMKILLKYDNEILISYELKKLIELLNCFLSFQWIDDMPRRRSLYQLCLENSKLHYINWAFKSITVSTEDARTVFQFIREKNYKVFKMFYELDSILYREGELIDEWSGNKAEDLF